MWNKLFKSKAKKCSSPPKTRVFSFMKCKINTGDDGVEAVDHDGDVDEKLNENFQNDHHSSGKQLLGTHRAINNYKSRKIYM